MGWDNAAVEVCSQKMTRKRVHENMLSYLSYLQRDVQNDVYIYISIIYI